MAKTLRFGVAIMVNLALLFFSAVVPGQLQQTFPLGNGVLRILLNARVGGRITQEVEVEASILVLRGANPGHTQDLLVELQAGLGILDTDHGVVQTVREGVRSGSDVFIVGTDKFNPVAVGILGEGNAPHTALCELLLERVASVFDSFTGSFDVVDGDGNVAEATVGLGVAVDDAVVWVALGAIVVGELQYAVAVSPVTVTLERRGTVVGEEVERELVLGEVQLLDLIEAQELVEFH